MIKQLIGLLVISILFSASGAQAQIAAKKYLPVLDRQDRTIYIDSTSIRLYENQISAVSLTSFKSPRLAQAIKKEVSSQKSQILFNLSELKYTINSSLFYDKDFRIIGESTVPNIPFGNSNLLIPINSSAGMTAIFNKALDLLKLDNIERITSVDDSDSLPDSLFKRVVADTASDKNGNTPGDSLAAIISPSRADTGKTGVMINLPENRSLGELPASDTVVYNLPNSDSADISVINSGRNDSIPEPVDTITDKSAAGTDSTSLKSEYNYASETNPRGTIFTDGSKFCYQVSSWRVKERAMAEVRRLKAKGFDAFITEVYLANKGGTWYRVRIGYFNSMEDAESSLKKLNR